MTKYGNRSQITRVHLVHVDLFDEAFILKWKKNWDRIKSSINFKQEMGLLQLDNFEFEFKRFFS